MSSTGTRMKSMRVISITGRIPAVQHQRVPVGIAEERHMANARVERVALERAPARLEVGARLRDVGDAQRDVCRVRPAKGRADVVELEQVDTHVLAQLELREAALRHVLEAERVAVEPRRTLHVGDRDGDEVRPFDDQPTEPSICSWIRRFISTAYSSGSSFVIGSTKPLTIIADASDSERPRDMR